MREIWKDVKDYEGLYQVSNLGRVRSITRYVKHVGGKRVVKGRILKRTLSNVGYYVVNLWKNNKREQMLVHRLVAETFLSNFENHPYINHIDGNKLNNNVNNLEWCTPAENNSHAYRIKLRDCSKINQYDLKGNFIREWDSIKEAQKFYNTTHISECCRGRRKKTCNFIWKYSK